MWSGLNNCFPIANVLHVYSLTAQYWIQALRSLGSLYIIPQGKDSFIYFNYLLGVLVPLGNQYHQTLGTWWVGWGVETPWTGRQLIETHRQTTIQLWAI